MMIQEIVSRGYGSLHEPDFRVHLLEDTSRALHDLIRGQRRSSAARQQNPLSILGAQNTLM